MILSIMDTNISTSRSTYIMEVGYYIREEKVETYLTEEIRNTTITDELIQHFIRQVP